MFQLLFGNQFPLWVSHSFGKLVSNVMSQFMTQILISTNTLPYHMSHTPHNACTLPPKFSRRFPVGQSGTMKKTGERRFTIYSITWLVTLSCISYILYVFRLIQFNPIQLISQILLQCSNLRSSAFLISFVGTIILNETSAQRANGNTVQVSII